MGLLSIVVPEPGTNIILNPSAELDGNFANHNSATVTRVRTHARFGQQSYLVTTGAVNRGINLTIPAAANAIHYITFYARKDSSALTGTLEVSMNGGTNYNAAAVISGQVSDSASRWIRYGVSIPAAQANGSTAVIVRNTVNENFYLDALMAQAVNYATTYIDGDLPGLYRWNGLRAGATSTRDAQERSGGRIRDLTTDYQIVYDPASQGYGVGGVALNYYDQPLQAGDLFKSDKLLKREMLMQLTIGAFNGAALSYQQFVALRKNFMALMRGSQYRGRQPFILQSIIANSAKPLTAPFRYASGMQGTGQSGFAEKPQVRVVSDRPYWYEDDNQVTNITLQQSISTASRGLRRVAGLWQGLGSGFNGIVFAIAVDKVRNRIYFGGDFTTANGVTVNGICYWNGTTFVAMGNGVAGGASERVRAIAVTPTGDVWIGGAFTTVDGAAGNNNIARWNISTSTWTAFGAIGTGTVRALAVDPSSGLLYVGGTFTNWNADANADYIVTYNGTTWAAMGTGGNAAVTCFAFNYARQLFIGGSFTSINGVSAAAVARWDGTNFNALSTGITGGGSPNVLAMSVASDGQLYVGGSFLTAGGQTANNVAVWNGNQWNPLSTGVNNTCTSVLAISDGRVFFGGAFTSAGGLGLADRQAYWVSGGWTQADCDLPSAPFVYAAAEDESGNLFLGFDSTGTASASAQTTVTSLSTCESWPVFYVTGPTTGSMTLQWLENQSSGDVLYFDLPIQAGETITIDLRPGMAQVSSDWRGNINTQPLRGSNFNTFNLLPGANTLAAFCSGTVTGAEIRCHAQPTHDSTDGAA